MAIPSDAYNTLMGLFRPAQAPAGSDFLEQAKAEAQNQMMQRFGMGLVAAAIPQTKAQRVQALQSAYNGFGDVGTSVYNAAQAKLMAAKVAESQRAAKADELFNQQIAAALGGGSLPQGTTMAPTEAAPMAPSVPGSAVDSSARRLMHPMPPSVAPVAPVDTSMAAPQFNQLGLTTAQTEALARITDIEDRKREYAKFVVANTKGSAQTDAVEIKDSQGNVLAYKYKDDKGNLQVENVPQDPAIAASQRKTENINSQAAQAYYSPTNGFYGQAIAAKQSLETIQEAKKAMEGGIFSGPTGAVQEKMARFGSIFGLPNEALANTSAFRSAMKGAAVQVMKNFGGNDTDREYREALDIVGGNTELTDAQLSRLLTLQESLAIKKYNTARDFGEKNVKLSPDEVLPSLKEQYPNLFNDKGEYVGNAKPEEKKINIYQMSIDELTKANLDVSKLTNEELMYLRSKLSGAGVKPQVPAGN